MIYIDDFVERLKHKPTFIGKDLCGVIIVTFQDKNKHSPSLEFGTTENEDGQYLYFEIVNFNDYKEGEMIDLRDYQRRKCVYNGKLTEDTYDGIVNHINDSLDKLYCGDI